MAQKKHQAKCNSYYNTYNTNCQVGSVLNIGIKNYLLASKNAFANPAGVIDRSVALSLDGGIL